MTSLPEIMRAMVFEEVGKPLGLAQLPLPRPDAGQVLVQVRTCGVCRTDLHVVDGDLAKPRLPLVPGHEIVGTVTTAGPETSRFRPGQRVGVPWLGHTCGRCDPCKKGRENLCDAPLFTGYTTNGGYAEYTVADEDYCFAIPDNYDDEHAAPLLCAGLIGYRSYRMIDTDATRIGLYGFGASAHIIAQVAAAQGKHLFAFTKPGDTEGQRFAREKGCEWAGDSTAPPPEILDAAIIFAPVGALVPAALRAVGKGGTVVCAGIHMSDIPSFPYKILWEERVIRSVANLQRADGEGLFAALANHPVHTEVEVFDLEDANEALNRLRDGRLRGAAVLRVSTGS